MIYDISWENTLIIFAKFSCDKSELMMVDLPRSTKRTNILIFLPLYRLRKASDLCMAKWWYSNSSLKRDLSLFFDLFTSNSISVLSIREGIRELCIYPFSTWIKVLKKVRRAFVQKGHVRWLGFRDF